MNQNGTISAMKKVKSASAVILLVSVSMMAMLAVMPSALGANEKLYGKVTYAGTGNPVKFAQVKVWNDVDGTVIQTTTNKTGIYLVNLPAAGKYNVLISNDSTSGEITSVTVATGQNLTLDKVLQPDIVAPAIADFKMSVVNGISSNHPLTFTVNITEKWFMLTKWGIYHATGTGDNVSIQFAKMYSNLKFFEDAGTPVSDITQTQISPGLNKTSFVFDGTSTAAKFSDGTNSWTVPYGQPTFFPGSVDVVTCYYENSVIGSNNRTWYMEFNRTTHNLKQIDYFNKTQNKYIFNAVLLTDTTGKVKVTTEQGKFNKTKGQLYTGSSPLTPYVFVKDIKPLVYDPVLPSGDYIIYGGAMDFGMNVVPHWDSFKVDNVPPFAQAGANITIKQGQTTMLNASASTDDMGIVNYTWTYKVGTSNFKLFNKTATTPKIDTIGVYKVNLNVTDIGGWMTSNTTYINVTDGIAPTVDAGKNVTVMQNHKFTLNGTKTTDNVDTVAQLNFTWTFNNTVKNVTLYGPQPNDTLSKIHLYKVQLIVKDRNGNIGAPAFVWVNVTDGLAPVANAGSDITVKQLVKINFNGNASTDNVGIVNYTWNFTSKGMPVKIYGVKPSYVFDTIGKYNVTLTVKDAAGLIGTDTVVVNIVDGIPPVVKAGTDMIDEVGAVFTFNGSASTDNIGIVRFNWSFGDSSYANGRVVTHAYTKISGTTPYKVVLTCTDGQGNVANATINVTVIPKNNPPTIKTIPAQTAYESVLFNLMLMSTYVNDNDLTDILNFSLSSAPANMVINSNTGTISWTPATNQAWHTYNVVLFVSDGKAKVNQTFSVSVIAKTIHVKIGPIQDSNGKALKDVQVSLMLGTETHTNKTDSNGNTVVDVPGQWAGQTVSYKLHKAGYNDQTGTSSIPTNGIFPNANKALESKSPQDYSFLIIVIVVLLILALVLFSTKRPSDADEEDEDEPEDEESLSEEE